MLLACTDLCLYLFPSTKLGAYNPLVKTCITNCGQMVPDTTMVCNCIDSLWKHTIALLNSTVVGPLLVPLPQKVVVKKMSISDIVGLAYLLVFILFYSEKHLAFYCADMLLLGISGSVYIIPMSPSSKH